MFNVWRLASALAVAAAVGSACAPTVRNSVPPGTSQPDQFLFERGTEALNEKRWLPAREFFKSVTETYTQSPYRPDAKLGVGDTYLGEGSRRKRWSLRSTSSRSSSRSIRRIRAPTTPSTRSA